MFRLLLSLFLLAAPSVAGNGLRAASTDAAESNTLPQQPQLPHRRLLDLNQIQFSIVYTMEVSADGEEGNASREQAATFTQEAYAWLKNVIETVDTTTENDWSVETRPALDPSFYGMTNLVNSEIFFEPRGHIFTLVYTVTFNELVAPPEMPWFDSIKAAASDAVLQSSLTGPKFGSLSTLSSAWSLMSSNARTQFEFAFVLPYRLTWSFNTTDILAPPIEYDAAVNATEAWINYQWKIFHGLKQDYALQNTDIRTRFTAFQASTQQSSQRYQQQLALYVQLVIGANNITDVPPIAGYLEQLQLQNNLFYFSNALEGFQNSSLPADEPRILPGTQFTFALAPTFEVVTVQESQSRSDNAPFQPIEYDSFAVVSVDLSNFLG